MESRQRRVWHQAAGTLFYTRFAQCHARLRRGSIQRASALIPCQAYGLDKKIRCFRIGFFGGNNRARTYDPLLVRQMLSQLSYAPIRREAIALRRVIVYHLFL